MRSKFVVAVVALALAGCSGQVYGPLEPSPPGTPTSGTINIVYDRTAAGVTRCLSAGTQWGYRCTDPVKVGYGRDGDSNWTNLTMVELGGVISANGEAPTTPPPAQLGISVVDPWLCPPQWGCQVITGRGITINGTRLKDGQEKTYFSFVPPTVYS